MWSGNIFINKIVKLDGVYSLYIDPTKSSTTINSLSEYYKELNSEIILSLQINPQMLCNEYDQYKIKSTKKFSDIDFTNSKVFIKLEFDEQKLVLKTFTKIFVIPDNKKYSKQKISYRTRFTSSLMDICNKVN